MSYILALFSFVFALGLALFKPSERPQQKNSFYFAPPELIRHFSFGWPDLYADILWMRLLQDIDFCSSQKGQPIYDGKRKYECETGWSYKMTSAITELAPRFLKAYQVSGSIMSIIMGDKLGAKKIFDKGLKNFPNNWKMHFYAGSHYLLELKDEKKAARLLTRAADLGGPLWFYALASKLYKKTGRLLLAREILQEAIKKDPGGKYKTALEFKLKQVEKEMRELEIPF